MKPLIEITSELYRKRLVRELNRLPVGDGFYAMAFDGKRKCRQAKFARGKIFCRAFGGWFVPLNETFEDGNGREVCASREAACD